MENQVKANSIRIQVLEEQNENLRNTITKVLAMQQGKSPPKVAWEKVKFLTLKLICSVAKYYSVDAYSSRIKSLQRRASYFR